MNELEEMYQAMKKQHERMKPFFDARKEFAKGVGTRLAGVLSEADRLDIASALGADQQAFLDALMSGIPSVQQA